MTAQISAEACRLFVIAGALAFITIYMPSCSSYVPRAEDFGRTMRPLATVDIAHVGLTILRMRISNDRSWQKMTVYMRRKATFSVIAIGRDGWIECWPKQTYLQVRSSNGDKKQLSPTPCPYGYSSRCLCEAATTNFQAQPGEKFDVELRADGTDFPQHYLVLPDWGPNTKDKLAAPDLSWRMLLPAAWR